jgi:hypothetical protein
MMKMMMVIMMMVVMLSRGGGMQVWKSKTFGRGIHHAEALRRPEKESYRVIDTQHLYDRITQDSMTIIIAYSTVW